MLLKYVTFVTVPYFRATSVFGFALMVSMIGQMWSGFLLALYYLPDPSFVMTLREEYFNEVWWYFYVYKAHVIGVDLIFTLSYLHILKKLYLKNYTEGDTDGWFTGAYAFLIYHLVVFLGITLSTNHLADVTITIAANIYWSLLARWHKSYAPFFTNRHLNVDQVIRFMVAHYISAYYYTYLVQLHVMYVHEMWDADANQSTHQDTSSPKFSWIWDALKKEVLTTFSIYLLMALVFAAWLHPDMYVINTTFFEQWTETEVEDINFFIVAPHWYFRPHMGLLTVCAQHYEGLFWMGSFYFLLNSMPHLYRIFNQNKESHSAHTEGTALTHSPLQQLLFLAFLMSLVYVGGTLPSGRFYYESVEGFFGNSILRLSYQYIFIYMGFLAHAADRSERWLSSLPRQKNKMLYVLGVLENSKIRVQNFISLVF